MKNEDYRPWKNMVLLLIPFSAICVILERAFWELIPHFSWSFTKISILFLLWTLLLFRKAKPCLETVLLFAFTAWMAISRIILGSYMNIFDNDVTCAYMVFCFFLIGVSLKKQDARRLLKIFTILLGVLLSILSICGLILIFTKLDAISFFSATISITVTGEEQTQFIQFATHRNESACWFMIELFLLLIQRKKEARRILKLLSDFGIVLMFAGIVMQRSRNVQVSTIIGVFLLICTRIPGWKKEHKLAKRLIPLGAVAALGGGVFSLRYIFTSGKFQNLIDKRDFLKDAMTFTGRTKIWAMCLTTSFSCGKYFFLGQLGSEVIQNIADYTGFYWKYNHIHNSLLQMFALCGFPGLLLIAVFYIKLLIASVRCLIADTTWELKILSVSLICFMIYGLLEPLLSVNTLFSSITFAMIAGIFTNLRREESVDSIPFKS